MDDTGYTGAPFTFDGSYYEIVIDKRQLRTPIPVPASNGEWVHVPYGNNVFVTDDTPLHTVWTVQIILFGETDWSGFRGKLHKFGDLVTPWGTKTARLTNMQDLRHNTDNDTYIGTVTWEWA